MFDGLLTTDPYNGVAAIGARNIFEHMVIKDCYEAGLISEDIWKSYLKQLADLITKEDNDGE